jgi:hypothetical protein
VLFFFLIFGVVENGANDGARHGCETTNDVKSFQGEHLLEMDEYLLAGNFE